MGGGDEDIDIVFVGGEEGVDVVLVDEAGALGLGEDEIGEEEEAEIGVEGEPGCSDISGWREWWGWDCCTRLG